MYESYVSIEQYKALGHNTVPDELLAKALLQASRHIDSLTYNRIVKIGFTSLTDFQRQLVREVVCLQADFEHENADEINTVLSSYSINGVSAQFGSSWNVFTSLGIAMRRDVYALLCQTGLCCRSLGVV